MDISKTNQNYGKTAALMTLILIFIELIYTIASSIQEDIFFLGVFLAPLFLLNFIWLICLVNNKKDRIFIYIFSFEIAIVAFIVSITLQQILIQFLNELHISALNVLTILEMFGYLVIYYICLHIVRLALGDDRDKLLSSYKSLLVVLTTTYIFSIILSLISSIMDRNTIDIIYTIIYPFFEFSAILFTILWFVDADKNIVKEQIQLPIAPQVVPPTIEPTEMPKPVEAPKHIELSKPIEVAKPIEVKKPVTNSETPKPNNTSKPINQNIKKQPKVLTVQEKIEVLKCYKELLDNDIITQEEFEAKKKEIL